MWQFAAGRGALRIPCLGVVQQQGGRLCWGSFQRTPRWKQHELPNFCPQNFGQLSYYARQALRRMRRRPTLVCAFWEQAELFPL